MMAGRWGLNVTAMTEKNIILGYCWFYREMDPGRLYQPANLDV